MGKDAAQPQVPTCPACETVISPRWQQCPMCDARISGPCPNCGNSDAPAGAASCPQCRQPFLGSAGDGE